MTKITQQDASRNRTALAGRARSSALLQARFMAGHGVENGVYEHLARRVHTSVAEIQSRQGPRSGALARAFGENFLKQKKRFCLASGEKAGVLCQNPGNWLQVLNGLALELGEEPADFILDAFTGSALLPGRTATGYDQESWLIAFERLIQDMTSALARTGDLASTCRYLFDSALAEHGGVLTPIEHQAESAFVDDRFEYDCSILGQIPYVLGLNYRAEYHPGLDLADPNVRELAIDFWPEEELPSTGLVEVESGVRTGLAYAVDMASGKPALALFEWRVGTLSVSAPHTEANSSKAMSGDCDLLLYGEEATKTGRLAHGSIRFGFVGSDRFRELAGQQILFPDIWVDDAENELWDPGGYLDKAMDYPTNSPARTVAAAVERNLLYAGPEGQKERRLDTILGTRLQSLEALITIERTKQNSILENALASLSAEWAAAESAVSTASN